jgi:hypothetical protein
VKVTYAPPAYFALVQPDEEALSHASGVPPGPGLHACLVEAAVRGRDGARR